MSRLRRLRALAVVSTVWGFLAASLYMVFGAINGVGAPVMPAISEILSIFILAWAVFMVIGVIVGLGLIAVAQGRRLQELSSWRVAGAGALGGLSLVFGFIGISGGFNRAEMRMWYPTVFMTAGTVAAITGACTLALTAIARRGKDRDVLQDIDATELLPPA